jgi:hypothetical protein
MEKALFLTLILLPGIVFQPTNSIRESISISISEPFIKDVGPYLKIRLKEETSSLIKAGKPILPVITRIFKFPLGSKIDVEVRFSELEKIAISKELEQSPKPLPLTPSNVSTPGIYPSTNYTYRIGVGIEGEERFVYVAIHCFPIKYSPGNLFYTKDIEIDVTYKEPKEPVIFPKEYDLLIIAPKRFSFELYPLIRYKESRNISTILMTTEDIYSTYDGRDKPERIKYFIKDAIEKWGIRFVLLVGGMKHQRREWHVPVRYSHLDDLSNWESTYISDLYYADIYRYNESSGDYEFEDWDSNGNGVFAEWRDDGKDKLDLYPDVYVGRLACRNVLEVRRVVNKIINYEPRKWFRRMIIVGGDTVVNPNKEFEGEIETSHSASYMQPLGFEIIKLFTSTGTLKGPRDVIKAISKGAGFVHFAGHGNPSIWSTHPPNEDRWINGLSIFNMGRLKNRYKLPICVVGGCHNSQFNVSVHNFFRGFIKEGFRFFSIEGSFWKYEWVPRCWSWKLIAGDKAGAIAVIGYTGLGYMYPGNYTTEGLAGWIEPRFFHAYAVNNRNYLGEAHSQAISDYVSTFDVDRDRIDRKTVEEWVLLGDPSLRIGSSLN